MPTLLITSATRSGKTSVTAGLLAWLRGARRSAAYTKPFPADGEADADHAFASGVLADGLNIAVGPAPRPLSAGVSEPLEALAMPNAEAEAVVIDAGGGSPAEDLAGAVDARVLDVDAYAGRQDWAAVADQAAGCWGNRLAALVVNAVPPYRTGAMAESVAESWAEVDAVVVPESRVMLAPTVARIADH